MLDTAPQRAKPRHRESARVIEDLAVQGDIEVQERNGAELPSGLVLRTGLPGTIVGSIGIQLTAGPERSENLAVAAAGHRRVALSGVLPDDGAWDWGRIAIGRPWLPRAPVARPPALQYTCTGEESPDERG
jgi:hypothetical protein